jgi:hypothetical protein
MQATFVFNDKIVCMTYWRKRISAVYVVGRFSETAFVVRARIQKPALTNNIVSHYSKAMRQNWFTALPNVPLHLNFTVFVKHCRYYYLSEMQYLREHTMKKLF